MTLREDNNELKAASTRHSSQNLPSSEGSPLRVSEQSIHTLKQSKIDTLGSANDAGELDAKKTEAIEKSTLQ